MRILILNLVMVFLIGCSGGYTQSSKEDAFWRWFQTNEKRLFDLETDRERIFDDLAAQLHRVNAGLTFEFGPKENGIREFVISADGIKDVFPSVVALADAAPKLPRWQIVKFRPRRSFGPMSLNGLTISTDQVDFTIEPDGEKIGITLFIDGYKETEHERYAAVAFLMLDHALGEYDIETKVGGIDFKNRNANSNLPKQPFATLVKTFDAFAKNH